MTASIQLRNVSLALGNHAVLREVSTVFSASKTTVLIGPSGCGKSSILRLIIGLIEPARGEVVVGSAAFREQSITVQRRRIGYVVQGGGLFPHLTAQGNIALVARYLRTPQASIEERLTELCELTRFPNAGLNRYPHQLSGGQVQRVALMRALMLDPEIVLLDEPLGALDPITRIELQRDLREVFHRLCKTVLMVTHDMSEAAYFGHEVAMMQDGRIVQQAPMTELIDRPLNDFVRDFVGAQHAAAVGAEP